MTTQVVAERPVDSRYQRLKTIACLAVVVSFGMLGAVQAEAAPMDREAFLKAVAEVETGGNTRAVGRLGERGLYQFNRPTWKRYTKRSFLDAHDPVIAHDIAVQHFIWLHARLTANGREPTDYQMAVAWNGGLSRALSGKFPRSTRDYARRVSTLANNIRHAKAVRGSTGNLALATKQPVAEPTSATVTVAAHEERPSGLSFTLSDAMVEAFTANEVVPLVDPAETAVAFSLSPKSGNEAAPTRRLFLATIVE